MKRNTILVFIGVCFALTINAANRQHENTNKGRFIEVIGVAEMNVNPDTLKLTISIREQEDGKNKKSLASIEGELLQDLEKLGLKKEDLKVANIGGVWRGSSSKESKTEYLLTKTFNLKLGSIEQVDQLLSKINRQTIDYIHISSLSNTNIKEYQKQTRAKALEAAREKAEYLIKSQGKELGEIIFIIEQDNNNYSPFAHGASNILLSHQNNETGSLDGFRKINLRYSIKVRFEIK